MVNIYIYIYILLYYYYVYRLLSFFIRMLSRAVFYIAYIRNNAYITYIRIYTCAYESIREAYERS